MIITIELLRLLVTLQSGLEEQEKKSKSKGSTIS